MYLHIYIPVLWNIPVALDHLPETLLRALLEILPERTLSGGGSAAPSHHDLAPRTSHHGVCVLAPGRSAKRYFLLFGSVYGSRFGSSLATVFGVRAVFFFYNYVA